MPTRAELIVYARNAAERAGVSPEAFIALIDSESSFRERPPSPAGVAGIAQFKKATAAKYGVTNRLDPIASLNGAAQYYADLVKQYGDYIVATRAYKGARNPAAPIANTGKNKGVESRVQEIAAQVKATPTNTPAPDKPASNPNPDLTRPVLDDTKLKGVETTSEGGESSILTSAIDYVGDKISSSFTFVALVLFAVFMFWLFFTRIVKLS